RRTCWSCAGCSRGCGVTKSPRTSAATSSASSAAVNVLLVGLGRWGEKHLHALRALGADVWAADVDTTRLAWAVGQGVSAERTSVDYRTMLDRVDAVDVVTPPTGILRWAQHASPPAGRV